MTLSQAAVRTEHGASYLKRLCKHWSHRLEVEESEERADINFGDGQIVRLSADANTLKISIWDEAGSRLDRLQEVVSSHLERFATKETLNFTWVRNDQAVLS